MEVSRRAPSAKRPGPEPPVGETLMLGELRRPLLARPVTTTSRSAADADDPQGVPPRPDQAEVLIADDPGRVGAAPARSVAYYGHLQMARRAVAQTCSTPEIARVDIANVGCWSEVEQPDAKDQVARYPSGGARCST
jgi:hypothetical protein